MPVTNRVGDERKESFTFFSETTPANLSVAKIGALDALPTNYGLERRALTKRPSQDSLLEPFTIHFSQDSLLKLLCHTVSHKLWFGNSKKLSAKIML